MGSMHKSHAFNSKAPEEEIPNLVLESLQHMSLCNVPDNEIPVVSPKR